MDSSTYVYVGRRYIFVNMVTGFVRKESIGTYFDQKIKD